MADPAKRLVDLQDVIQNNRSVVVSTLQAETNFSYVTMFLLSALQRIESNADAMSQMFTSNNYPVACAVLRMQIDTAMRVNGLSLMANRHEGISSLVRGERYDQIKPKTGDKLRDVVLLKSLDEKHGWIKRVYDRASGMVHLSGMHIHHMLDHENSAKREDGALAIDFVLSPTGPGVPIELFDEACEAFVHISIIGSALTVAMLKEEHLLLNSDAGTTEASVTAPRL